MSIMALIGLIAIIAIVVAGVIIKLYTKQVLRDMDGVGNTAIVHDDNEAKRIVGM